MVERIPITPRNRSFASLGALALFIALLAAYANHFHNSFHFDDAHTVENNAAIREVRNIPMFFRDATTFSSLPSNQSYRPLVSTLLAIDYRLGGLQPFWFHLSILALFVALTLLLAFVIHRLLERTATSSANRWIALAAAAWYGLHPATRTQSTTSSHVEGDLDARRDRVVRSLLRLPAPAEIVSLCTTGRNRCPG
jgi:hypothetical protein